MLHIHNGDLAAGTAKKADIPGEHFAFREALVCGPAPGRLSSEQFRSVRARHLVSAYGVNVEKCELELREQEKALARFSNHEEIVLWFEHDLFCQIHLVYLLNWFKQIELGRTKLSLICVGEFPGIEDFRGLGQLSEEQLSTLFPLRQEVSQLQSQLGSRAWQAYSSSDPAELLSLLDSDLSAMPFLKRAFTKHLERFPSTKNGLGRIANAALGLVAKGYRNFKSLFPAFASQESEFGFGDAQLYLELRQLVDVSTPLLTLSNGGKGASMGPGEISLSSFEITEVGTAVLDRKEDFVRRNGINYWLGGVHLEGDEAAWRWEEQSLKLLARL